MVSSRTLCVEVPQICLFLFSPLVCLQPLNDPSLHPCLLICPLFLFHGLIDLSLSLLFFSLFLSHVLIYLSLSLSLSLSLPLLLPLFLFHLSLSLSLSL